MLRFHKFLLNGWFGLLASSGIICSGIMHRPFAFIDFGKNVFDCVGEARGGYIVYLLKHGFGLIVFWSLQTILLTVFSPSAPFKKNSSTENHTIKKKKFFNQKLPSYLFV